MRDIAELQARWIDTNQSWVKLYIAEIHKLRNELNYKKKNKSNSHWVKTKTHVLTQPEFRVAKRKTEADTKRKAAQKGKKKKGRKNNAQTHAKENGTEDDASDRQDGTDEEEGGDDHSSESEENMGRVGRVMRNEGEEEDYVPSRPIDLPVNTSVRHSHRHRAAHNYAEESHFEAESGANANFLPVEATERPIGRIRTSVRVVGQPNQVNEEDNLPNPLDLPSFSVTNIPGPMSRAGGISAQPRRANARLPLTQIHVINTNEGLDDGFEGNTAQETGAL
jgi:hypothetical protein